MLLDIIDRQVDTLEEVNRNTYIFASLGEATVKLGDIAKGKYYFDKFIAAAGDDDSSSYLIARLANQVGGDSVALAYIRKDLKMVEKRLIGMRGKPRRSGRGRIAQ